MAQITLEQFNELKRRGLTDEKIKMLAESKGLGLPVQGKTGLGGVATGFIKGGLEIARETAQLAQSGGQRVLAVLTPQSLEEIQAQTGFESLKKTSPIGAEITEQLKAKSTEEKIGKIATNVAAFFIPTAKTAQTAGRIVKGTGETVSKLGIRVSVKEAPLLQAYKAKFPLGERILAVLKGERLVGKPLLARETALKQGIAGTESMIGVQAKRGAGRLWKEVIDPALEKVSTKVNMKKFIDDISKEIEKIPELSRQHDLKDALRAFKQDYKSVGLVDLKKLQQFKEGWAKFLPDKIYQGKPIAGSFKEIQNIAAHLARNKIYEAIGDSAVKAAYFDYGNLKSLQELGKKALQGSKIQGGTGTTLRGLLDIALVPLSSVGGLTLYKAGKGIEFIGATGLKVVREIFGL